jgi:hypothetical protein
VEIMKKCRAAGVVLESWGCTMGVEEVKVGGVMYWVDHAVMVV